MANSLATCQSVICGFIFAIGITFVVTQAEARAFFVFGDSLVDSQHMGSEATLPYLSPELTGRKLLVGANFASAGIGILNDTGIQFVSASPSHTYTDQNS
ncbi:hypothetical protein LguiA_017269 [Lonicera macranthoides]